MRLPEVVVGQLEVDYGETQLVEPPRVQVMELGVLDVQHVVEQGVELVLQRADHALERLHFLADDHDPGPDHAGEVAARARRDAAPHGAVKRRVVQYERAAHGERAHGQEVSAGPNHGCRRLVPVSGDGDSVRAGDGVRGDRTRSCCSVVPYLVSNRTADGHDGVRFVRV